MACSMFKRLHHRRIEKLLRAFDADLLREAECYFGGGTAITLSLGEYRESVDIDFLCANPDGYRTIYTSVDHHTLGRLLATPVEHKREPRKDRDAIRTFLVVDELSVKVEFVLEARIALERATESIAGVPVLSRVDMYAEKLLANTDCGRDRATLSRDVIDLAMMMDQWGPVPQAAWRKAYGAYGAHVARELEAAIDMVRDSAYLRRCTRQMQMDDRLAERIPRILEEMPSPPSPS